MISALSKPLRWVTFFPVRLLGQGDRHTRLLRRPYLQYSFTVLLNWGLTSVFNRAVTYPPHRYSAVLFTGSERKSGVLPTGWAFRCKTSLCWSDVTMSYGACQATDRTWLNWVVLAKKNYVGVVTDLPAAISMPVTSGLTVVAQSGLGNRSSLAYPIWPVWGPLLRLLGFTQRQK